MPFKGQLTQGLAYTFTIEDGTGGTALTFLAINRRDKIASAEPQTVPNLETKQFAQTFSPQIDRLELFVRPSNAGGVTKVTVSQGVTQVLPTESFTGDVVLAWDTLP